MDSILDREDLRRDLSFTANFFLELGGALGYLHDRGFHRDLKEANILLDENNYPILSDLGIAHVNPGVLSDAAITDVNENLRNSLYSTPEQHFDPTLVTYKTDIASFGYLLNHWLTGEPARPNALLPSDVLNQQDAVAIDTVIESCIARNPEKRYKQMRQCMDDIKIAFGEPTKRKKMLGAFGSARRKVRALSRDWPETEPLSAATLKGLYLLKNKFSPDRKEANLIFGNLLLLGRTKNFARKVPDREPTALGWYWFRSISKQEALEHLERHVQSRHWDIREGVARTLGVLGTERDLGLLWEFVDDSSVRVASTAIKSIGILGGQSDWNRVRALVDSRPCSVVKEAIADVLWRRGDESDFNLLSKLLLDDDPNVARMAVHGLVACGPREKVRALLEQHHQYFATSSHEYQAIHTQVKSVIQKYLHANICEPYKENVTRTVEGLKSKLSKLPMDRAKKQAYDWISEKPRYQDAGIEWLEQNETPESLEKVLEDPEGVLPLYVLQHLDEFLYRPNWWRDAFSRLGH